MWRIILFLVAVVAAAFLCIFIVEQHGVLSLSLGSRVYETSLAVALAALLLLALVIYLAFRLLVLALRLPLATFELSRSRRKAKGSAAISKGLVAVASGDLNAAARHAQTAERLAGHEPLALLLKAQAAQLQGDRATAKQAFARMAEISDTRGLGLRGLFVEARRRGDGTAAHHHAAEATQLDVFLPWAHEATLMAQCQARDWLAALTTLERNHRLGAMGAGEMRRAKAALLAARALDLRRTEPKEALKAAFNALKIDPGLTPAAATAARLLAQQGQQGKAARIIEAAWRLAPHPDLASAYLALRSNPSAAERVKQIARLAALKPEEEESVVALAQAFLAAREFAQARAALASLAEGRPTARICVLMAEIEEAENGMTGHAREWLARAAHAPRDPAWIADGVVSSQWEPVAPESGRIGAFAWEHPPELAGPAPGEANVPARMEAPRPSPQLPPPVAAAGGVLDGDRPPVAPAPAGASVGPVPSAGSGEPVEPASQPAKIASVTFPLDRAPDDPGAEPARGKGLWSRLTR
ncbi:MAG: heme biosynthesis protein HemY [Hyphomicrobiales bacterium]